jgi:hypothetical protein
VLAPGSKFTASRVRDTRAPRAGRERVAGAVKLRPRRDDRAMTDRRPLRTGPATAEPSRTQGTDPLGGAQLAAERLPSVPAAEPKPARLAAGRRALGTGPAPAGQ